MIKQVVAVTLLFSFQANSQFELSGQFRPRSEFRQGFQQLFDSDNAPAFFIDQRSRISSNFKNEKIEFHFVLQDYRTWGNTPQLNTSDYGLSIHESWAKLKINKLNNVKLGRQEIVFDNARIFGNVDWAQQGRKHDAILYNYKRKHEVNVGFAYNSNNPSLTNQTYTVSNNYKTLGFARTKLENEKMKLSLLFISVGRNSPTSSRIFYEQTAGAYLSRNFGKKLKVETEGFYQFGNNVIGERKNAYFLSFNLRQKLYDQISFKLGAEILSGNNLGETSNGFDPLFGTHHKFYGHMDYFYVGNPHGNKGLQDYYFTVEGNLSKNYSYLITSHYFLSNNPLSNTQRKLGFETDCVFRVKLNELTGLSGGYSIMLADENMRIIKQGDELINHLGWLMLDIKTTLFKTNKK